jgi:hypothetical protein
MLVMSLKAFSHTILYFIVFIRWWDHGYQRHLIRRSEACRSHRHFRGHQKWTSGATSLQTPKEEPTNVFISF